MEAPKCKLCGERHYGLCAKESDAPGFEYQRPRIGSEGQPYEEPNAKPKFDRTTYQRELMRKRRAKEREK